jgi:hypothetical protein
LPLGDRQPLAPIRRDEKLGAAAIACRLGIGRASVYRLLGRHDVAVQAKESESADQA